MSEIKRLATDVLALLNAQKMYFKTRNEVDLIYCKKLEKDMLARVLVILKDEAA